MSYIHFWQMRMFFVLPIPRLYNGFVMLPGAPYSIIKHLPIIFFLKQLSDTNYFVVSYSIYVVSILSYKIIFIPG